MSSLLEKIFTNDLNNKTSDEKQMFYDKLILDSNFETFQYFSLCEPALNDIVGTQLCNILYKDVLKQMKKNQNEYIKILFAKILEKHININVNLKMTNCGWKALKQYPQLCYNYIKFRKINLNPSFTNISILNSIRKCNIHICDNHVKYWIRTKRISYLLSDKMQNNHEHFDTLSLFFSKLSLDVINLILEHFKNKNIFFPLLSNINLDDDTLQNIFLKFDMTRLFRSEIIHNYFYNINQKIFCKYYKTISPTIRPRKNFVNKIVCDLYNKKISSQQIANVIDFCLFFHVKPPNNNKKSISIDDYKQLYVDIMTHYLKHFTIEQQLKLNPLYISLYKMDKKCEEHLDPLLLHHIYNNFNSFNAKTFKSEIPFKNYSNITSLCDAILLFNIEILNHLNIWEIIFDVIENKQKKNEIKRCHKYDSEEEEEEYDSEEEEYEEEYDSEEEEYDSEEEEYDSEEEFKTKKDTLKNINQELENDMTIDEKILQICNTILIVNDEKKTKILEQLNNSYHLFPENILIKIDEILQSNVTENIYMKRVEIALKTLNIDMSLLQFDKPSKKTMASVLFNKNNLEFGICNICWENNVEFACKDCGNCACSNCNKQLKTCAICKKRNNFVKLHF